jgi:hypothetical protein
MKQLKLKLQQLKTLAENLQKALDKPFLILAICLILFSGYFVELIESVNEKWQIMLNLYRVSFLLIIYVCRDKLKKIMGGFPFYIAIWLLLNNFYDRYMGVVGWSTNDTLTILTLLIEYFINKKIVLKIK